MALCFSGIEKTAGRFPQVSGLKVVYDPRRPPGARVMEVHHDGAALDPDGKYTLVTNDFMARGATATACLRTRSRSSRPGPVR